MTFLLALVTIIQTMAVSLGVGSSTLAIANFFVAIADGKIDETERRMMGVVYVVLRVAMVLILATTLFLIASQFNAGGVFHSSIIVTAQLFIVAALYTNAMLMTAHLIPTTFGPAIQGGSWYTLGFLAALQILGYVNFSFGQFLLAYITWIVLAIGIINGLMTLVRSRREAREEREASS